jgi:hypothetical protein
MIGLLCCQLLEKICSTHDGTPSDILTSSSNSSDYVGYAVVTLACLKWNADLVVLTLSQHWWFRPSHLNADLFKGKPNPRFGILLYHKMDHYSREHAALKPNHFTLLYAEKKVKLATIAAKQSRGHPGKANVKCGCKGVFADKGDKVKTA